MAAHHASALMLSASLAGRGKRWDVSFCGAKYEKAVISCHEYFGLTFCSV